MTPDRTLGPCGKRTYPTLPVARKLARRVNDSGRERVGPYHCTRCHGWHLGTSGRQRQAQKSPRGAGLVFNEKGPGMDQDLQQLTVPAGTIIKINGAPFKLPADTSVLGLPQNLQFALSQSETCCGRHHQADAV